MDQISLQGLGESYNNLYQGFQQTFQIALSEFLGGLEKNNELLLKCTQYQNVVNLAQDIRDHVLHFQLSVVTFYTTLDELTTKLTHLFSGYMGQSQSLQQTSTAITQKIYQYSHSIPKSTPSWVKIRKMFSVFMEKADSDFRSIQVVDTEDSIVVFQEKLDESRYVQLSSNDLQLNPVAKYHVLVQLIINLTALEANELPVGELHQDHIFIQINEENNITLKIGSIGPKASSDQTYIFKQKADLQKFISIAQYLFKEQGSKKKKGNNNNINPLNKFIWDMIAKVNEFNNFMQLNKWLNSSNAKKAVKDQNPSIQRRSRQNQLVINYQEVARFHELSQLERFMKYPNQGTVGVQTFRSIVIELRGREYCVLEEALSSDYQSLVEIKDTLLKKPSEKIKFIQQVWQPLAELWKKNGMLGNIDPMNIFLKGPKQFIIGTMGIVKSKFLFPQPPGLVQVYDIQDDKILFLRMVHWLFDHRTKFSIHEQQIELVSNVKKQYDLVYYLVDLFNRHQFESIDQRLKEFTTNDGQWHEKLHTRNNYVLNSKKMGFCQFHESRLKYLMNQYCLCFECLLELQEDSTIENVILQ